MKKEIMHCMLLLVLIKNPRYALSIIIEHGGSGGKVAAPMAKKLFKLIIDRHEEREKIIKNNSIIS